MYELSEQSSVPNLRGRCEDQKEMSEGLKSALSRNDPIGDSRYELGYPGMTGLMCMTLLARLLKSESRL
jgi:hypothetical protein